MFLASLSDTGFWAVVGGYALVVVIIYLIWRKDILGRRRAVGCIWGLALFGLLFVLAFAGWAADNVF